MRSSQNIGQVQSTFKNLFKLIQDILLSTLNFTSKFIQIPTRTLQKIETDIFRSIKKLDPNPFGGHHKIGFYSSIGFLPLEEQNKIILSRDFVTLTDDLPAGETTRMRATEFTSKSGY